MRRFLLRSHIHLSLSLSLPLNPPILFRHSQTPHILSWTPFFNLQRGACQPALQHVLVPMPQSNSPFELEPFFQAHWSHAAYYQSQDLNCTYEGLQPVILIMAWRYFWSTFAWQAYWSLDNVFLQASPLHLFILPTLRQSPDLPWSPTYNLQHLDTDLSLWDELAAFLPAQQIHHHAFLLNLCQQKNSYSWYLWALVYSQKYRLQNVHQLIQFLRSLLSFKLAIFIPTMAQLIHAYTKSHVRIIFLPWYTCVYALTNFTFI